MPENMREIVWSGSEAARPAAPVYGASTGNLSTPDPAKIVTDRKAVFYGGTVRRTAGVWHWIANHGPAGLGVITYMPPSGPTTGFLRIAYAPSGGEMPSFLVGPDETYAQLGYSAGASVGASTIDIFVGDRVGPADPATISDQGNFWLLGMALTTFNVFGTAD